MKRLLGALPPDQSLGQIREPLGCLWVPHRQLKTSAEIKLRQIGITLHGLDLLANQKGAPR
jgi:hypothetical protein